MSIFTNENQAMSIDTYILTLAEELDSKKEDKKLIEEDITQLNSLISELEKVAQKMI